MVARSSIKAEYRRLEITIYVPTKSLVILCDNQTAVTLAHNPIMHSKTKNIGIDIFFVKEVFFGQTDQCSSFPWLRSIGTYAQQNSSLL